MNKNDITNRIKLNSPTLSVNIIGCDLMKLGEQISLIEKANLHLIHFDIKDGCFVPTITFGPCFVKAINTGLIKHTQLMIHDPSEKYIDYIKSGADIITLHIESDYNLKNTLKILGKHTNQNDEKSKIVRGLAINPDIPVQDLAPFLDDIDLVTVMTYNPKMIDGKQDDLLLKRINEIKKMIDYADKDILLCINGGINKTNIKEYRNLGADILVVGSAIFKNDLIIENINELLSLIKN